MLHSSKTKILNNKLYRIQMNKRLIKFLLNLKYGYFQMNNYQKFNSNYEIRINKMIL